MSQSSFAMTILERAGMKDANSALTPAVAGRKYTKADCPNTDEERDLANIFSKELYHTLTASTNFLVCGTRPDMKFIQGKLAKFTGNPGLEHQKALKYMLRFLKGTTDYGIEFKWDATDAAKQDGALTLEAYSDSSYGDCPDTGRTTIGHLIKVNGATVDADSKLSRRVDSCVNHSELHAFDDATARKIGSPGDQGTEGANDSFVRSSRTVTWARGVKAGLERRDESTMPPTNIYVDNAGVLSMLNGQTLKAPNKHIFRALAENRERVQLDKIVIPAKINTKVNLANAMTKQEPGQHECAAQLRLIAGPPTKERH
jgi:hypothetical protein